MRLTAGCRAKALEAGLWQRGDGTMVRLRRMHPAHLLNAYLGALAAGDPAGITRPLAAEVIRRGLAEAAWREVQKRTDAEKRAQNRAPKVNSESQNWPYRGTP